MRRKRSAPGLGVVRLRGEVLNRESVSGALGNGGHSRVANRVAGPVHTNPQTDC